MKYLFLSKAIAAANSQAAGGMGMGGKLSRVLTQFRTGSVSEEATPPQPAPARPSSPEPPGGKPKVGEAEEAIIRANAEVREAIRTLLRMIETRDHIQVASRRAYRALDHEVKTVVSDTLRNLVAREKESISARERALLKLEKAVEAVDTKKDIDEFSERYAREEDTLMLYSQALSLIGDISEEQQKGIRSWSPTEADASDVAAVVAAANTAAKVSAAFQRDGAPAEPTSEAIATALVTPLGSPEPVAAPAVAPRPSDPSTAQEGISAEAAFAMLHHIFYLPAPPTAEEERSLHASVSMRSPLEAADYGTEHCAKEVLALQEASSTQAGRTILVLVLNQFRSKKVFRVCLVIIDRFTIAVPCRLM